MQVTCGFRRMEVPRWVSIMRELILGGQKSGKSRRAESLAAQWLAQDTRHQALLIATARAGDDEMAARIARHQQDRLSRVPGLQTLEEPVYLADALHQHSQRHRLLVVDCLPLWLTNWWMPVEVENNASKLQFQHDWNKEFALFLEAFSHASGPVALVSNEIGLGVIPLGAEVRAFVDRLGQINQQVATLAERVTFMAAGLPLTLKGQG